MGIQLDESSLDNGSGNGNGNGNGSATDWNQLQPTSRSETDAHSLKNLDWHVNDTSSTTATTTTTTTSTSTSGGNTSDGDYLKSTLLAILSYESSTTETLSVVSSTTSGYIGNLTSIGTPMVTDGIGNGSELSENATLPHVQPHTVEEIVQIVILSILFLLSLTGNLLALIKISRKKSHRRHSIYQLMLQLIVADLFVTFFCLLSDAIHKITLTWYADDITCKLLKLLGSFAQFLSSYIVALVAVNRALVVIKPMLSPSKMKKIMQYLITGVWVFSLLMSVPQLIIWRKLRGPYAEDFYDCTTIGHDWTELEAMLHAVIISSFIFIVPLIIMAVSYILVIRTLAKTTADQIFDSVPEALMKSGAALVVSDPAKRNAINSSRPAMSNAIARSTFYSRAKLRSQRMSLQISIWYSACWLPYIIVFIAMSIKRDVTDLQEISRWCIFFGQTNCIINPIIYASFHISKKEQRRSPSRAVTGTSKGPNGQANTKGTSNYCRRSNGLSQQSTTQSSIRGSRTYSLQSRPKDNQPANGVALITISEH